MPGITVIEADGSSHYYPDSRPIEDQKEELVAQLADRRWQASQFFVFQDQRTQADAAISAITGAVFGRQLFQQMNGVEPPPQIWKLNSKSFVSFTTAELVMFGFAAQAHISACFENEKRISSIIDSVQLGEELDAVNIHEGWPGE